MKVALVSMPWASVEEPSLGLSILKSSLQKHDVSSKVFNFNALLLKYIKHDTYRLLADACGINDFIFTSVLDPNVDAVQFENLVRICEHSHSNLSDWQAKFASPGQAIDTILEIRRRVIPEFINECVEKILNYDPIGVGLTCLYDQTMPAVSLCKALKDTSELPTVLGGYSVAGDTARMLIKAFPFLDTIIEGDGEIAIVNWTNCITGEKTINEVPGAIYLENGRVLENRPEKIDLVRSPYPNFDDFFCDLESMREDNLVEITNMYIPVESSRGCWWGQKTHCTFCGIDKETLNYRQKPPEQVIDMLHFLENKYGKKRYTFVDYILPHNYQKTLLPNLSEANSDYYLTCEAKSNIKPELMSLFRMAGFREIQPGIESFCTNTLSKMDKGVNAAQNVLTLKMGKVHGVQIHYNILYGFPDDEIVDYESMVSQLPSLYHLNCPHSCMNVLITRHAPLFSEHGRFGYNKPKACYRYGVLFSLAFLEESRFDIEDYAYIFDRPYSLSRDLLRIYKILETQVGYWREKEGRDEASLTYIQRGENLIFTDCRLSDQYIQFEIEGMRSLVYLYCDDKVCSLSQISGALGLALEDVKMEVEWLAGKRLIFSDCGRYVGLGIRTEEIEL